MIYYLKHNLHKLNWAMIGNVLGMVLIAQACLMVLPVIVDLIYQEGFLLDSDWNLSSFRICANAYTCKSQ